MWWLLRGSAVPIPLARKARVRLWEGVRSTGPCSACSHHTHTPPPSSGEAPGAAADRTRDLGLQGLSSDACSPPLAHVHRQRLEACVSASPTRANGSHRRRGGTRPGAHRSARSIAHQPRGCQNAVGVTPWLWHCLFEKTCYCGKEIPHVDKNRENRTASPRHPPAGTQ